MKYPLYRMILKCISAILCNDVDLAERVESSTVNNEVPGNLQTDAYKDALDLAHCGPAWGLLIRSISLLDTSRLKIEAYHDRFEARKQPTNCRRSRRRNAP